jgi:hypothetical protein
MTDTVELFAQYPDGRWRMVKEIEYLSDQYVTSQMQLLKATMNMRLKAVSKKMGLIDILD